MRTIPEVTLHQYSWEHVLEVYFISYLFIVLLGSLFIVCFNPIALSFRSTPVIQRLLENMPLGGAPEQLA